MVDLKPSFHGRVLAELVSRTLFTVLLILGLYGGFAYYLSKKTFDAEMGTRLSALGRMSSQQIRPEWIPYIDGKGKLYEEFRTILERQRDLSQAEDIYLLDPQGRVLVDAKGKFEFQEPYWMLQLDPEPFHNALRGVPSVSLLYQGQDGGVYKVAYQALGPPGKPTAVLGVEASANFIEGLHDFAKVLFLLALVCLGIGAAMLYVFGRRLVAPIRAMSLASKRVAAGDFSARVMVDTANELGELGSAFNDMTEQLQAHNDYILESMANGLVVVDLHGLVTTFNQAASRMLRIPAEQVLGKPAEEIFKRYGTLAKLADSAVWEGARLKDVELTLSEENPTVIRLQTGPLLGGDGRVLGTEMILTDQTQLRQLEGQVKTAEKMATIGELAAGIAHEIRNPLGAMKGFTEILVKKLPKNPAAREMVEDIASEIEILNKIVTNFLVFARPTQLDSQPLDLSEAVQTVVPLIEKEAERRRVRIDYRAGDPVTAQLDLEQFRRAVLNVALNAVQASPEGGVVEIAARGVARADLAELLRGIGLLPLLPSNPAAQFALVEVRDRGGGLPQDPSKLFTPFFTTKTEGFGLGLSITKKILEAHGGGVGAAPREGGGAQFFLVVPAVQPKEGD